MESVWHLLTTPNEGLIGIIFNNWGIPFIFIEIAVSALLFTQVFNIKYEKKQLVIYVLILAFISGLSNTILPKPYSAYINMIAELFLIIFIFKTSIFKSILAEFVSIISIVIFETIFCKLCTVLLNVEYEQLYLIPLTRLFITMLIYISIYILYTFFKHYNITINVIDNISKKNKYILILNFIFAIVTIAIQFYIIGYYLYSLPIFITLLSMISLIIYFFISIYSLVKTTKLEVTSKSLEEAQLYNKTLNILHDNLRTFRHDFCNIMQSLGGYIADNDMEGLKLYYDSIRKESDTLNNLTALNPNLINDAGLYSLITSKYYTAEQDGIKFNINILANFNDISISTYTLSRILGILLDNAIDAARISTEKEISFSVYGPSQNSSINRYIINIENTYSNKDVNIDKIFEKGYSSKTTDKKFHGIGLWEVNKLIKKNKNLNLKTEKNSKYFIQNLEIFGI